MGAAVHHRGRDLADLAQLLDLIERALARTIFAPSRVVYYVRKGDRIKIGYTSQLHVRMATLEPDALLAVEPGGTALEAHRHRQFRDARDLGSPGREWFRMTPALLAHVAELSANTPPPSLAELTKSKRNPNGRLQ